MEHTNLTTTYSYTIPTLEIEPGPFLFTYVSELLSLITPDDLPLNLVRDALYSNLTIVDFTKNAIKIESGFIAIMSVFVTLSLIPLGSTLAWCCRGGDRKTHNVDPVMNFDDSLEKSLVCRKRTSICSLVLFVIILFFSDIAIFYASSRLSSTIGMTPELVQSTINDMGVFLKDTHLQIKHKLDTGFHIGIENVTKDLEDIDILLGEPIRMEVSASTGIELAFDSLNGISMANAELVNRILVLQETVGRALKISQEASQRMEELQIQLSVLQRQCTFRDRPLCDTLRIRSFEENGIIDSLKALQEDQSIFRMRYLGELDTGSVVKNLSSEVAISKSVFGNFPYQVKSDTIYLRNDTLEQLSEIRHQNTANAQMLTHTIVSMLNKLSGTWESFEPQYEKIRHLSDQYWTLCLATAWIILWVLILISGTLCCYSCKSQVHAGICMFISISMICIASFGIMLFAVATLAVGGNSEVFLCRPLFDDNHYRMLGKLFDKPGYFYEKEPQTGIIGELLRPSDSNETLVNVSLAKAIRDCENNKASYKVFQLDVFVNTTQIGDLKQFPKVNAAINAIRVSDRTLLTLTQSIQSILDNMLQTSQFNLTSYRSTISTPTPEKDLATFIDQMQRVALQIQDVATSSRMTTLGSRAKRLQASILQPLEQLQNEILYHLTALELQRDPWAKQVNQTLYHLRNIQGYLEKTAYEICQNQTKIYTARLKSYLTTSRATMSSQLGDRTAMCRPLFDIFDANRTFLCRNAVDYLNAIWFFAFICLLLWSIIVPLVYHIIILHNRIKSCSQHQGTNISMRRPSHTREQTPPLDTSSLQSNWGTSTSRHSSRNSRRPPSSAPPPPPPPQMTRQDSIRSVRWETEEMVFEDVDSPNPIYSIRDNLV